MITSTTNARIRQVVAWQTKNRARKNDKVFVAEGLKMFEEAPAAGIREVYLTERFLVRLRESGSKRGQAVLKKLEACGYETVTEEVMKKAADTLSPQGILTVLNQPSYELEELLKQPDGLYLLAEDIQDPGNLGTMFRAGEGAGITGIVMTRDTVDVFNPKVIRGTMGSVYRVPFVCVDALLPVIDRMRGAGITTYAAHLKGKMCYDGVSFQGPTAFIIGNEGSGLKEETADAADFCLRIPMEGKVESLNAAVSASLLAYEAHRQRKYGNN